MEIHRKTLNTISVRSGKIILLFFLLLLLGLSYCRPLNFTIADLGRHLKNGEVTLTTAFPPTSNYYSYTQPEHPVVNHHWGSGVLFHLVQQKWGFYGLSLFHVAVFLSTFLLFFFTAQNHSTFCLTAFISVLCLPLITSRLEIRPEGFSYLFLGLSFFLLTRHRTGTLHKSWLIWSIPMIQLLWVNLHLFFILGLFLILVFLLDSWLVSRTPKITRRLLILLGLSIFASLINPFGWHGLLAPFLIFKEYGYAVQENYSLFTAQRLNPGRFDYYLFEGLLAGGMILSIPFMKSKTRFRTNILFIVLLSAFAALTLHSVRAMIIFGFFCIPILSCLLHALLLPHKKIILWIKPALLMLTVAGLLSGLLFKSNILSPYKTLGLQYFLPAAKTSRFWVLDALKNRQVVTGLLPYSNASATFFKTHQLTGPIFNNYDIGGYLIYHLFPGQRVFVDNRPEAYSTAFFQDELIPMQQDEQVWKEACKRYDFNTIFFQHHDATPWARPFLERRSIDPEWAIIYYDPYAVIFLKRTEANTDLISTFELKTNPFNTHSK